MENITQEPYRDSSASSRSSSIVPSDNRPPTAKSLPSLPTDAPPSFEEVHCDEPSPSISTSAPRPRRYRSTSDVHALNPQVQLHYTPYTDTPENDDDDVPLAHLYPYPTEAPPAYHVVVRQSHGDTLIAQIPTNFTGVPEGDEEEARDLERADDVRFPVERVVVGLIVSMVLLLISCVLVWNVVTSTSLDKFRGR